MLFKEEMQKKGYMIYYSMKKCKRKDIYYIIQGRNVKERIYNILSKEEM